MKLVGDFVAVLFHGLCVVGDDGTGRVGSGGGIGHGCGGGIGHSCGGGCVGDGRTSGDETVGTHDSWGAYEAGGSIAQGGGSDQARLRGGDGNGQNTGEDNLKQMNKFSDRVQAELNKNIY